MKKLMILLILVVGFALPAPARADVAPPAQPPGSNLQPGEETTQVWMKAEKVVMEIKPGAGDSLGMAQVTADFTLRNLGSQTEIMAVRFPISANDGRFNVREIRNLEVRVDGRTVGTRRIQGEDPYWGRDLVPWAEFNVSFPPEKDVLIRVSYTLDGSGYFPFTSFNYILSSGAGWKDTIGKGEVVVKLPYEATPENVLLSGDSGYSFTSDGARLDGNEVRWEFKNLEPTPEDNLRVELVAPSKWLKVVRERENVARNPNDGEAWGRLGKLYKEVAFLPKELRPDLGGQRLYDLSEQAYRKCLELKPNDAEWHVGYAELLWWKYNTTWWSDPSNDQDLKRSLDLLNRAFELNRKSARVREMLSMMAAYYPEYVQEAGEGYVFLYLTATPVTQPSETPAPASPTATVELTVEPTQTSTHTPLSSPTAEAIAAVAPTRTPGETVSETAPTQTPEPAAAAGKTGICGAGVLLPLVGVLVAGRGWRRAQRRG